MVTGVRAVLGTVYSSIKTQKYYGFTKKSRAQKKSYTERERRGGGGERRRGNIQQGCTALQKSKRKGWKRERQTNYARM